MVEYIGRFLNKVDRKGRVSVPALWRSNLTSEEFSGIVAQPSEENQRIDFQTLTDISLIPSQP